MGEKSAWEKLRKIKKPHICFACCETYIAGDRMIYVSFPKRSNLVWHGYLCRPCWQIMKMHGISYENEEDLDIRRDYPEELSHFKHCERSSLEIAMVNHGAIQFSVLSRAPIIIDQSNPRARGVVIN